MSGSEFGSFILGLIVVVIVVAIAVWLLHWLYLRSSKERAFVRTGLGGQKVVLDGGAFVLPIVHDVIPVNMNTLRLEVSRGRDKALITKDRMRVDVIAEFYVRVAANADSVAAAAQTLGLRTTEPAQLRELVEGKFIDALRTAAAEMTMEELHEKRGSYVRRVREAVAEDLTKNGLELEAASITQLDQTSMEFFNPSNAFDAEGLTRLTEQIEQRKKQRNDVEQDTLIAIRNKNLEAEKLSLTIDLESENARLMQQREVEMARARQRAEVTTERAQRDQDAEAAQIAARQAIEAARIRSEQSIEQERIERIRAMAQRVRSEMEAESLRMMNEAHNVLSPEARMSALRLKLVEKAEAIIRESVKPMERIEGIKILHVEGLAGGGGGTGGESGGAGFADSVVNSALRFRAQAPIVDQLLREIGLEGGDIGRLAAAASGGTAALPPAKAPAGS
ncbi:MAG: flotillin family protein [Betaproteobacteria bacterium]|nr:flotillin family protein [Betaproteobacteria bacterium]